MLGTIAITAALASLAASLYGQGKLSVDGAWQLVPPVLVPTAVTVGAESRQLGQEVVKLKHELQMMQAEVKHKAKRKRAREGDNTTDANTHESEDEGDGDVHAASVRSLQRQLSQMIVQLETARQQLGDEQRLKRELEEGKRRMASDLQARETELLTIRRDSEASLKDLLKSEVVRARDETEAKMKHEHLTSKHQSVEQVVTKLEDDLSSARAEGKVKDAQVERLRSELVRIRSVLAGEDMPHSDVALTSVIAGGEVALAKTMRAEVKRLTEESKTLRRDLAQEREKCTSQEASRKKAEEDAAARKLSESSETEKRRSLWVSCQDKLASELEAKLDIKLQAAESLLAREKKLVDECDAKLVTARAAGATTCDTQCAAKVTSARQAAATACSSEWEAKTSSATIEWEAKMSRATIAATSAAATSAAVTTAHTECNTNTEKMRASHIAEVADATHAAEAAAASQKVEVVAAIENVLVCETQLQAEVKRCSSAGDEVEKCRKKMLECSSEQEKVTSELTTCRDNANATSAQATNEIQQAAAKMRQAETALQEVQLKVAAAEAQRQQAETQTLKVGLDGEACQQELEACTSKPCLSVNAPTTSISASSLQAAVPIKELSPDMLKLSPEATPKGAHGESDSDSELCGLTPSTCSGAADVPDNAAIATSTVSVAMGAKTAAVHVMPAPELEAHIEQQAREGGVTFVKFFAPWCGHCKKLAPLWEQVGEAFLSDSTVTIAKVDCTQAQDLCKGLGIEGLPTFTIFSHGSHVGYTGKKDAASLIAHVNSYVNAKSPQSSADTPSSPGELAADGPVAVAQDSSVDAASCGLTPGSCSRDSEQVAVDGVSGGTGASATNSSSKTGEMSDMEIAAMYDRVKKGSAAGAGDASPAASAASATPAASSQLHATTHTLKPDAPASQTGKRPAPASGTPASPAAAPAEAVTSAAAAVAGPEAARQAQEAQRRWQEALKNDPKRAEQMEYRARRAAGPALAGSDEEKGGTAAENKFCQSLAGEHAIFDGKEGGCRCKRDYTEDDEGKCIPEQGKPAQEEAPPVAAYQSTDTPSAPPASPAVAASSAGTHGGQDAKIKAEAQAAEAQRRWQEALKNDPKRAEQMEYRARRAAGPALAGSDEEKGGTAAENKFCQSLAGEHAIFDGKEGGCRCKRDYTEDDEGKCIPEPGTQTPPIATNSVGTRPTMAGHGASDGGQSLGGLGDEESLVEFGGLGGLAHDSLGTLGSLGDSDELLGSLGSLDDDQSLGSLGESESDSLGGFSLTHSDNGGDDSLGSLGSLSS